MALEASILPCPLRFQHQVRLDQVALGYIQ